MTAAPSAPGNDGRRPITRALVSVYDKSGLEELARALDAAGVGIVSTGSTAKAIAALGIEVTPVEALTGFPECLEGRVKTLHPKVHAGILADTRKPDHLRQLDELGVAPFELVVVNLYPFLETVASGATPDECIEQDRHRRAVDGARGRQEPPERRHRDEPVGIRRGRRRARGGGFTSSSAGGSRRRRSCTPRLRRRGRELDGQRRRRHERRHRLPGVGRRDVRAVGGAALRREPAPARGALPHRAPGVASAEQLHGKEMSYNNYVDTDAAVRAAHDHGDQPTVAIIKHANPCGIAVGATIEEAYERAHATDP